METARSTGNFNRRITVTDSNNIIAILDMNTINSKYQIFEKDYLVEFQAVLEDLKVTVGLMSLAEAPWPNVNALMSEPEKMTEIARIRTQGQKISLGLYVAEGNGPWKYESEVVLQNQGGSETHVPILVPFLSSNETLLIAGNFKLGVRVEPKWNQPLKVNDYLIIKGTWRQVVSFSKKKDDDLDALNARISSLELALEGRLINLPANTLLGRGANSGVVERLASNLFAIAADTVNTTFAQFINGAKTFLTTIRVAASGQGAVQLQPGTTINSGYVEIYKGGGTTRLGYVGFDNVNLTYQSENGANHTFGGGNVVINDFTTLGDNVSIKLKRLVGITAANQGQIVSVPHGLTGDKILGAVVKIFHSPNAGLSSDFDSYGPGYAYDWWHDAGNFNVQISPTSSSLITNKSFSILIFYIA